MSIYSSLLIVRNMGSLLLSQIWLTVKNKDLTPVRPLLRSKGKGRGLGRGKGKGPYHRDRFRYDLEKDIFLCPEGKKLKLHHIRRKDYGYRKFQTKIYKCKDCPNCKNRSLCTRQKYRTINREDRKVLVNQIRNRLQTEVGGKKYLQRLWTTEPVFGHLKYNLGYRHFFLRSLKKVRGEFRLMCIGWNLKKMHKLMAFG